jgi:WD40 repeat protein
MSSTTEQGNATTYAATWLADDPASSLRLALDALDGNSVRQAETLLRWALGHMRQIAVLRGHQDWVMSASFSPDGRFVLTACLDHKVRVLQADTGEQCASIDIGAAPRFLSGMPQFSFDGTLLIVPGFDGLLHIGPWQGASSLPVLPISANAKVSRAALTRDNGTVITGHKDGTVRMSPLLAPGHAVPLAGTPDTEPIACVAVSPDGQYAAAGTRSGDLRLWDLTKPTRAVVLPAHADWVNTVEFSSDNRLLVSSSDDYTARLFSVPDGRLMADLRTHTDRVISARFSHDAKLVVTACVDKKARVFDAHTGEQQVVMHGGADELQSAEFSPDGRLVAMASVDGTSRICYAHNGGTLLELKGHESAVFTVAFDPSGTRVATASADRTARLWDVGTGQVFWGHRAHVNTAVFSDDGRHVATACEDDAVRVFEAAGGSPIALLAEHNRAVNSAAFSPDGTLLVTAGQDGTARVTAWQTANVSVVLRHDLEVDAAAFSSDGNKVITSTRHEAALWDWQAGQPVMTFAPPLGEQAANPFIAMTKVDISRDNSKVVTAHYDRKARLWDAATGAQLASLEQAGIVYTAVFSHDSRQVITASGGDGHARIWDANSGDLVRILAGPSRQLRCAALSPDGRWAAAGDPEGNVTIWSVIDEQVATVLRQHADTIMSVVFSPDSTVLLTASDDWTAKAVAIDSFRPLKELVTTARRHLA